MAGGEESKFSKSLNTIKNNVVFEFIAISFGLYGYWQSIGQIQLPFVVMLLLAAMLFAAAANSLYATFRRISAKRLPFADGDFKPFRGVSGWEPFKRKQVTKELCELLKASQSKHVLLVSPSGNGKSTMLYDLIPAALENYEIRHFENYKNIVQAVLLELQEIHDDGQFTEEILDTLRNIDSGKHAEERIFEELNSLIGNIDLGKNVLLCFDQVERYFLKFDDSNGDNYDRIKKEHEVIKVLLKCLSRNKNIRTIFAIRSEYIFGSLSSMFNLRTNGVDIDEYVEFYFLWGINYVDDKSDYASLSKKLSLEVAGVTLRERLFNVSQIDNQMRANTFMLNLGGYLFEKFQDRPKLFEKILRPGLNGDELIDAYLDAAFEGFTAEVGSSDRTLFDTVLYSLANENKVSGQACNITRLAGLAHYPKQDVTAVVAYLGEVQLLTLDASEPGGAYRLGHDKISDRLLKSDKLQLDSRAIDGIRYLTENRVKSHNLTVPSSFPNSLDLAALATVNISYLSVLLFVVFGAFRCVAPESTFSVLNYFHIYNGVSKLTGYSIHKYYFEPAMYVPHFIAHVAWVSYIDRVNRSFLRFSAKSGLRFASYSLSTIGALLGVAVAYSPELFVVPIVAVGMMYGCILMLLSRKSELGGQMKEITLNWGYRSFINVSVVLGLSLYILAPFFQIEDASGAASPADVTDVLLLVVFEALMMLWFWQHIKAEQNTRRIWSANLALFDKGRIFGR